MNDLQTTLQRQYTKAGDLMKDEYALYAIAFLLFLIWLKVDDIAGRLKEHFPTEKEQEYTREP